MRRALFCSIFSVFLGVCADRTPIVAFGDSLTAGFGAEAGGSYPDYLQKLVGEKYRVINAGVSGDTTADGLERLSGVLKVKAPLVILELGGNDGLRGLPVASTRANLEEMIVALQKAGSTVVLCGMTLPRNYGVNYVHSFEQIYVELAKKYKLVRVPFLLDGVALSGPGLMQRDGIHPTAQGNEKVAATVYRYLAPLLKR